ncbi:polysaccharide biosynthesis/export family protein [Stieleria sp. TO1_6]|uniref:polysaccharide biosynthesis/export family protein n=1 Tax=Stieleria tagensis TaxID=2956795 RepID=UPI00209A644C|nr:polysaccharide biosynthesis/export family protein [Stieleria tagensis]MCO8121626.1 polysaccharide biosynthesis/export family protein [Stieleria tagensis]
MIRSDASRRVANLTIAATLTVVLLGTSTGCHLVSSAKHAIPAHRLDPSLFSCPRESMVSISYAALGQDRPPEHLIGAGDTLSVYVYGVFPANEEETPVQQRTQAVNQRYYPPRGTEVGPSTGLPLRVDERGMIELPLIGNTSVAGKTIPEAIDLLRKAYQEKEVLKEGNEQIYMSLIIPRVRRVVVLREDTPNPQVALVQPTTNPEIHRGSGQVIDLPIYENDVLHALAATGGLPGTDASRELYVIRREAAQNSAFMNAETLQTLTSGNVGVEVNPNIIRIPLSVQPCDVTTIPRDSTILHDGDVVFVPRRNEYFVTGGLLPGARIALPRDEDIDVIEAIAMATGSPGGPLGLSGAAIANANPGYIREATRVLILRKLGDGRQITIRVDLDRAINDAKERIRIQPDDVVMVQQKPAGAFMNVTMNWLGGQWIPNAFLINAND